MRKTFLVTTKIIFFQAPKGGEDDDEDGDGETTSAVETIGGTAEGATCQFPFEHNGEEHETCVHDPARGNGLMCVTDAETGKWGFCKQPGTIVIDINLAIVALIL